MDDVDFVVGEEIWERKSCRVRYSLREMKIKVIKDYSEEFELMDTWRQ